jgi:hypothetical protein
MDIFKLCFAELNAAPVKVKQCLDCVSKGGEYGKALILESLFYQQVIPSIFLVFRIGIERDAGHNGFADFIPGISAAINQEFNKLVEVPFKSFT